MALLMPWIELVTQHGYQQDFGWFWMHDYLRVGTLDGIMLHSFAREIERYKKAAKLAGVTAQ